VTPIALGEIVKFVRGVSYDGEEATSAPRRGTLPILRAGNIRSELDTEADLVWVPASRVNRDQQMALGDIAICMSSGSAAVVGKSAILDHEFGGSVGAFCGLIRASPRVHPPFLALWMRSNEFINWRRSQSRGASIQNLRFSELAKVRLELPPIEDQRQVADRLTSELRLARDLESACHCVASAAATLRVRCLRDLIALPMEGPWPWVRLDEVTEFLDSQRRPIESQERQTRVAGLGEASLVPYYGANGRAGWIDDYLFDEALVLLAEDGGAFGSKTTPIAYRIDGRSWVNNHAHVLRPKPRVDVDFLGFAMSIRPDAGEVITGSTRGKLNRSLAAAMPIPLPPVDVQIRIAFDLRERLGVIDQVEAAIRAQQAAIDALLASLLRRAFADLVS
jgi:restriction endonuclease S subunit